MVRKATRRSSVRSWRRWISAEEQEMWIERLREAGFVSWALTERPLRSRLLLEIYIDSRAEAVTLTRRWGGRIRAMNARQWIDVQPAPPTRIGRRLEIIHAKAAHRKKPAWPRLYIPHGLAFGSGEHPTTYMLLRALSCEVDWIAAPRSTVLDFGTGSGVLALTARLLGAGRIVATDFDPDSIRTARQNELLNFSKPVIRWRCADVRRLRPTTRYDLVLANLFSGILIEVAPQIADCVTPGGRLWLSGILAAQKGEVVAAYRRQRLKLVRAVRRGKWIMLQWARPPQEAGPVGGAKKATQIK